jgi:hypothetical protein
LEVEIPPARSILYLSSSKELLHTALAGVICGGWLMALRPTKARLTAGFVFYQTSIDFNIRVHLVELCFLE